MPIAIGEATKVISFIQNKKKKYLFTIRWGVETDTDDLEGKIIEKSKNRPKENEIIAALDFFIGDIYQKPPIFSAIKINGQRSYKLARKKIHVSHKERLVNIYDLNLKKIIDDDSAEFELICGKGTYVRSLARDIAYKLNTKGCVSQLRRLSVGKFEEKDTIFLDFFKEIIHSPAILNKILPIQTVLDDIPALVLNEIEARQLKQGQKIQLKFLEFKKKFEIKYPNYQKFEKLYVIYNKKPLALIEIKNGVVKPIRVLNN